MTPGVGGRRSPASRRRASSRRPRWWGTAATGMLLHARGIEQHTKGVDNVLAAHQPRAGHRQVRQARLRGVDDHRAGQRPGRPRARPQVRPAARQPRHHQPRAPRRTSRRCGAATSREIPGKGIPAQEIIEAIHDGHDQGSAVDLLQPGRVGARRQLHRARRSTSSSSTRSSTSSSPSPAHHADVVLPGSLHEEDEGTSTSGEGRIIKINAAVTPPGEARLRLGDPARHRRAARQGRVLPVHEHRARSSRSCAARRRAAPPTTRAPRGSASRTRWACSGRSPRSATPARRGCYEGGQFYHPDGKARFHARAVPAAGRGGRRRVPDVAHHRPGRQPVPVGHPDPAHRRARRPVPRAAVRDAPAARRAARRRRRRPRHRHVAARRDDAAGRTWSPRSGPTPCSSRTTGPGDKAANQLTNRAVDPLSKMPEFKVAAVRVERAGGHATRPTTVTSTCTRAREPRVRHRRQPGVRHRPEPVHRLRGVRAGVRGVRHPPGPVADPPRAHRPGARRTQTAPMVCMHCEDPTCAQVCPADAIKQTEDGIVQSALKPRCIGCSNCVLACPFGVPEVRGRVRPDDEVRHVHRPHVRGLRPDVRVGVPERGAVVRHASRSSTRPARGSLLATSVRPPGACAPRCTPSSTTSPAARSTCSAGTHRHLARRPVRARRGADDDDDTDPVATPDLEARLPLRGRRRGGGHPARVRPLPRRRRRRDGRRQRRPRRVDPTAADQHRRAPSDRRPRPTSRSAAPTCSATPPTTTRRSCCASPSARSWRSARSAPTSAASSTSRRTRTGGTAPATRATSTPAPAP